MVFPRLLILFSVFTICIFGCKKEDEEDTVDLSPIVDSISPSNGGHGTQVTIKGSRFTLEGGTTTVAFNGEGAQIISVEDTMIIAIVPVRAGTGPVKVNNGDEPTLGPVFSYIYSVSVSTFCGDGTAGFIDGLATVARFNQPAGLDIDPAGNVYVADQKNHRIRRISPNGFVSSIAGSGLAGHLDATPAASKFNQPTGVTYDKINDKLYVADKMNHCIRLVQFNSVTTIAGTPGSPGYVNGAATISRLQEPNDVQVYSEDADLYIADAGNHCIRKFDHLGVLSTFAGKDQPGLIDGIGLSARFNTPVSISFDSAGYFFITDAANHNIRRVDLGREVTTVAGSGAPGFADGFTPLAQFDHPASISIVNGLGFICDKNNHRIRTLSITGNEVSTAAGSSTPGFVNGSASQALFNNPTGIVKAEEGVYFVSDAANHVIRKVTVE